MLRCAALQVHNEPWRVEGSRVITETATDIKHVQQVWDTVLQEGGQQKVRAGERLAVRRMHTQRSCSQAEGWRGMRRRRLAAPLPAQSPACLLPSLPCCRLTAATATPTWLPLAAAAGTAGALGRHVFDECRGAGVPLPLPPGAPLLP